MKHPILKILITALVAAVSSAATATSGSITYTVNYNGNMAIGTDTLGGVTYTTVSLAGLRNDGSPGMPFLPVDYISFSVPYNATNFTVSAQSSDISVATVAYMVYPRQLITTPATVTLPNTGVYYSGNYYPAQPATVVDEGLLAGENRIVTVAVTPVSFRHKGTGNLAVDQLKRCGTVSLTLNYDLDDTPDMFPVARQDTVLRNKGFELARGMVVNPDDVRGNALSMSPNPMLAGYYPPGPQAVNGTPNTYLMVTSPEMKRPLRRLAALRRQKGIPVKEVTIDEVLADTLCGQGDVIVWAGEPHLTYTDNAGKLRQYLRMHYYYLGTEYVLLAGSQVPYRVVDACGADVYFGELNVDWASQDDSNMELFVGRLLGSQERQADYYTDKLLRYELNPGNGDYGYLQRALFTSQPHKADALDFFADGVHAICPDTTHMVENAVAGYPAGNDVLDSISTNQYALIGSFNEATPSHMVTHSGNGTTHYLWAIDTVKVAPSFTDTESGNGLNRMLNRNHPAIYVAGAGQTMPYARINGYDVDVNYGESFTMGKDYGGPVFMGFTTEFEGQETMYYLYDMASRFSNKTLCESYSLAKNIIHMDWEEELVSCFNFLGDPVVEMWTAIPQTYSGITVTRGDSTISVTGVPVGSAVSYYGNDGSIGLVTASSSTVTLAHVDANSSVMLYRRNMIPYIAPLVLQNTTLGSPQYVIASEVLAGRTVDTGRASGEVIVPQGGQYEIEATGEVRIEGGFRVEQGAQFSITPSTYNK